MFLKLLTAVQLVTMGWWLTNSCLAQTAELRCQILDVTGAWLTGAEVELRPMGDGAGRRIVAISDKEAQAIFSNLDDGNYRLTVRLDGFLSVSYELIRVTAGYANPSHIKVALPFGDIVGLRTSRSSGLAGVILWGVESLRGARICFSRVDPEHSACAVTDRLGVYSTELPPGKYEVTIFGKGRWHPQRSIDVPASSDFVENFVLPVLAGSTPGRGWRSARRR